MMTSRIHLTLVSMLVAAMPFAMQATQDETIGIDQVHRIDLLPKFKRSIKIGAVTSYDRTEGNDDGFSGTYSFVRKEGKDLVLADIQGPGCIYRIHTPTPTDDPLEFYFDGESTPRIRTTFNKLYSGTQRPFISPLVGETIGGYTCYVPIPFKKSVKILLKAPSFQFYDVNYAIYPESAGIKSFSDSDYSATGLRQAKQLFTHDLSKDLTSFNVAPSAKLIKTSFSKVVKPGQAVTVFESRKGGRIVSLRLSGADVIASKNRDLLIRVTWDGDKNPAIYCPIGDFFGYAFGKPAMGSVLIGTNANENYCNLPMPYAKSAKIEIISQREGADVSIKGEVITADLPKAKDEGRFYAYWHRENPTTEGKPFTYLSMNGRGHIVGLALQAQGPQKGHTYFFEGDDLTTIDGELAIHGTGSEDSFNGGWYDIGGRWDRTAARPFSGCMLYDKANGRTGGYRFFVGDCYPFTKSILQTIEHAPEKNQMVCDYTAVTYFYSEKPPMVEVFNPTLQQRQVVDLK